MELENIVANTVYNQQPDRKTTEPHLEFLLEITNESDA